MSNSDREGPPPQRFSLKRWSTRKLEAARVAPIAPPENSAPTSPGAPSLVTPSGQGPTTPPISTEPPLPAIETLNFDSDFTAFLSANVAEPVKRQALKKLFSDPRFNVMDGLDVYIDDYSIPSPIEPELVSQLLHSQFTLNPPATRINAQGHVEDVPPEERTTGIPGDPAALTSRDAPALTPDEPPEGDDNERAIPDSDETSNAIARSHAAPDQG